MPVGASRSRFYFPGSLYNWSDKLARLGGFSLPRTFLYQWVSGQTSLRIDAFEHSNHLSNIIRRRYTGDYLHLIFPDLDSLDLASLCGQCMCERLPTATRFLSFNSGLRFFRWKMAFRCYSEDFLFLMRMKHTSFHTSSIKSCQPLW